MNNQLCQWTMNGFRKKEHRQCDLKAVWSRHGEKPWLLCDAHKRMLLESYNEQFRAKEEPEWKPISEKSDTN